MTSASSGPKHEGHTLLTQRHGALVPPQLFRHQALICAGAQRMHPRPNWTNNENSPRKAIITQCVCHSQRGEEASQALRPRAWLPTTFAVAPRVIHFTKLLGAALASVKRYDFQRANKTANDSEPILLMLPKSDKSSPTTKTSTANKLAARQLCA